MRNLRKLTAAVLAIAIVLTSMTAVFAAETVTPVNSDKATVLNELGLYAGVSTTTFDPDLGASLTRQQATVMLLKMFGMADKATALTDEEVTAALESYTDADKVASWAKKAVAYAVANKIMSGVSATEIDPAAKVTGAQYATLIVKSMGYDVADYKTAVTQLSKVDGSTVKDEFSDADLTRDNAVGYMYGALTGKTKDGTTVIANLVTENPSIAAAAEKAGLYTAPTGKGLDVDTVVAVNSKIVEVTLNTEATAADVTAAKFAVKDASGKAFNVVSAAIAPWSSKSALVTLEADTTGGTLYTLTIGDKSYNFGGKAVDTGKPSVSKVEATDANEVTVTFDEAIKLETMKIAISESYGTKSVLAVNGSKYDGSNKVVLSVGDMKDATLYTYTITDVTDLAGNQLDSNKKESTFVGKAKPTDALKFADTNKAKANYCDEVAVKFNVNVDPASLVPGNFTITEAYGTKATVAVTAVRLGKDDDKGTGAATESSNEITSDSNGRCYAILTVDGTMKDATLYEIKFSNMKTLYGVAQSSTSTDYTTTFVGIKKPTDAVELSSLNIGASSNTTFTITFKQKMDKALAETLANYTLVEAYGNKAALEIKKAELQSNGTDIKFTTAAMNTVLYKLTINNLKDIYGNVNKTSDSANQVSIAGKAVASKIDTISGITRVKPSGSTVDVDENTQIVVAFNGISVGSNATDVSLYSIDGGVGYPSKAAKIDGTGNEDKVLLTIGKTTAGTSYKLTVKGLLNADGVVMGSDGASASFAGKGNAYTYPKMQNILATDKQTIKIYFDRSVDSSDIKGHIWTDTANTDGIIAGVFKFGYYGHTIGTFPLGNKAWKDPDNSNVLIVRTNAASFNSSTNYGSQFTLDGTASGLFDADNDSLTFANNDSVVALPQLTNIMANDNRTITVYFDQAVVFSRTADLVFDIGTNEAADAGVIGINAVDPVKVDDKTYKITTTSDLTNITYYLRVNTLSDIKDKSGFYSLKPTNDNGSYKTIQFGGSTTVATGKTITDVTIMMTDKSTIQVHFPERMDKTTVTDVNNYKIYKNSDANAAAVVTTISAPTAVVYDADTLTATLYLSGAVLDGASNSTYYLGIDDSIANEVKLKYIKNDKTGMDTLGSGILVSFAASTADDVKPTIKNVSVNLYDRSKITVEFDEAVSTATKANIVTGTATSGNDIVINDGVWSSTVTTSSALLFTVTNKTTGPAVNILSITKVSNTKFEIQVDQLLDKANSYEFAINLNGPKNIYNLGGTQIEVDSSKYQKYIFTATKD